MPGAEAPWPGALLPPSSGAGMTPATAPLPLPSIPPEVAAFAAEAGVTAYLPGMLEMTRRIFPSSPMKVLVEDDPEIANDRHIVLEVEVGGVGVQDMVDAQWR